MTDLSIPSYFIPVFDLWRQTFGPFLLWWAAGCGIVVLLTEIAHQLISSRQIAFKAFLWRMCVVVALLLPVSFAYSPLRATLSLPKIASPLGSTAHHVKASAALDSNRMVAESTAATDLDAHVAKNATSQGKEYTISSSSSETTSLTTGQVNARDKQAGITLLDLSCIVYLIGLVAAIAIGFGKWLKVHLFLLRTHRCDLQPINDLVEEIAREIGLGQKVNVRLCSNNISPALLAGLRPTLIFPVSLVEKWKVEDLRPILYHELNHLTCRDQWFDRMRRVTESFLWFFPGVYWLRRRLDEAREALCDAKAVITCESPRAYADLLLRLAETLTPSSTLPVFSLARDGKRTLRRLKWILKQGKAFETTCSQKRRWSLASLSLVLLLCLGGIRISVSAGEEDTGQPTANETVEQTSNVSSKAPPGGMMCRLISQGSGYDFTSPPSLDGKYIIARGRYSDLMVRELATGRILHRLSLEGPEYGSPGWGYPKYSLISPDNRKCVYQWFIGDKQVSELHLMNFDGSGRRVLYSDGKVRDIYPVGWSPDTDKIVALYYGKHEGKWDNRLFVISVMDGEVRELKALGEHWPDYACFSPDGDYIAYDGPGVQGSNDIFLIKPDGTGETPLLHSPANEGVMGWSPDGKWIFYTSDRLGTADAYLLPIADGTIQGPSRLVRKNIGNIESRGITQDGSFYYELGYNTSAIYVDEIDLESGTTFPQAAVIKKGGHSPYPSGSPTWSPDGKHLAYLSHAEGDAYVCALSLWSSETKETREIPLPEFWFYDIGWFPDGKSVLSFRELDESSEDWALCRIDLQTGEVSTIVSDPGGYISGFGGYLPDGKSLVYRTRNQTRDQAIIVVYDTETGEKKEVFKTSRRSWCISLSPDGQWLALDEKETNSTILTLLPLPKGDDARELLRIPESNAFSSLSWAPDSNTLFYVRDSALWGIPTQGGEPRKLYVFDFPPSSCSIHPDGKRIAFASQGGRRYRRWVMMNFLPKTPRQRNELLMKVNQGFDEALENQSPEESLEISDTLIEDDFDDGDMDGWVINENHNQGPPFEHFIEDGVLTLANTGILIGRSNWKNYTVRLRFCPIAITDHWSGVIVHLRDNKDGNVAFCCFTLNGVAQAVVGYRQPQGKFQVRTLSTTRDMNFETGKWYELQTDVIGDNFKGYIDGKLIFDVTNDDHPEGYIGIKSNDTVHFDDFSVRLLD